jgi:hypothetical protein
MTARLPHLVDRDELSSKRCWCGHSALAHLTGRCLGVDLITNPRTRELAAGEACWCANVPWRCEGCMLPDDIQLGPADEACPWHPHRSHQITELGAR